MMKYYKLNNEVYAFENDGSQDEYITEDMVRMTTSEVDKHLKPETKQFWEIVEQYVERLARAKAHAVLGLFPDAIVIAADTSLSFAGKIIGKPQSKQHAFEIWSTISGQ